MLVINDIHLNVNRSGGTTPLTFQTLTNYMDDQFEALLDLVEPGESLLINGDLNDGFLVTNRVFKRTHSALAARLQSGKIGMLYVARGNHDISKDSTKLSSFDLLGALLHEAFPEHVVVITQPTLIEWRDGLGLVIPHAPNQDIYDMWIDDALAGEDVYDALFLHTNYDNGFAAVSDHSLNTTKEQCKALNEHGFKHIIFAHEHQQKKHANGVVIVGNQFPGSVSDCLGNESKRCLRFEGSTIHEIETWRDKGSYFECDWEKLDTIPATAQFVRVKGEASEKEVSDVLEMISGLRKRHSAFVITNAVVVNGQAMDTSSLDAIEDVKTFDVVEFLFENLSLKQIDYLRPMVGLRNRA